MPRHVLLAFALSLIAVRLVAQPIVVSEPPRSHYGLYFDLNINFHTADFRALPGVPNCCPRFESGSGAATSFGLLYRYPFSDALSGILRAGYSSQSATLRSSEGTVVIVNGQDVPGEFEHVVEARLSSLVVQPLIGYRLTRRLHGYAGGEVGLVTTSAYTQAENLLQPTTTGTFENGQRTRNNNAGKLPDASKITASILIGMGLDLPLNRDATLLASPEIFYTFGLTPVVRSLTWRANSLRLGLSFRYAPRPEETTTIPVTASPDITPIPHAEGDATPMLAADLTALGVERDGTTKQGVMLRIEEFISTNMRPLLNYIFFEENSALIPMRYVQLSPAQATGFRLASLHDIPTLPTYYQSLNIIGRRMLENPRATITLVGCNADEGEEKGNQDLSRHRAETVRDYLASTWGVERERMKIEARNLPAKPTNQVETDGASENRRVEIHADDMKILEPVITSDTLLTATPPIVRFQPTIRSKAGVARWVIAASQRGVTLKTFSGSGPVPPTLDWNLEDDPATMPRVPDSINYTLTVVDASGQEMTTPSGAMPVDQMTIRRKRVERIADREIDRYSLILFDFDQAELNDANRQVAEFIRGRISPKGSVMITGFTDRIGEAEHNLKLSEDRARNVAAVLNVPARNAVGQGESATPYDNDLPEGRFYSRTVNIVVETPVE